MSVRALMLALLLAAPLAGPADALDPRLEAAVRLYREEGADKALPAFEALAHEFDKRSVARDRAAARHYVGECHWRLGHFADARQHLNRALSLERASRDRLAEGKTLNVLGLLAWDQGEYATAIEDFRKAGAIARALGDRRLEGSSLNNLSLVYDEQGDYDTSLEQYRRVLELYEGADFPRGVGDTLGNMGGVHLLLGQFREALGYYRQALAISERLQSGPSMSQDHGNIGHCLLGLGEIDAAHVHLDRAIELAQRAGMRQDQAYWLRVKGDGYVQAGRYDLALQSYRAALATYETIGAQAELLEALYGSGRLHLLLGDSASAERDFRRALEMARKVGLDRGITVNLIALGDLEFRRKQPAAALALYEEARQRAAAGAVQHVNALSLLRLARVNRSLLQVAPASTQASEALAIARRIEAPDLEAEALYSRAEAARLQKRHAAALENYRYAQGVASRIGDPDLLWRIEFGRARTLEATGRLGEAVASLEAAIKVIEGVRRRLEEPRFRSGYLEDKSEVYLALMRLQLQQGGVSDAFSTAERLRSRSFDEQFGGRASMPLSAAERRTEDELRERVRRLQRALAETDEAGAAAYPERARNRFSEELSAAEKDYQVFLDDHARVRSASGDVAPSAESIQRRLEPDQALLEYVVGPDALVVFVLTSRGIRVTSFAMSESDLAARIDLLRDLIRRPGDERWRKPAARLSEQLIGPVERTGSLEGVRRLYVVPHGPLTYLPFALLPGTAAGHGELLVERYTVAYLPAAVALVSRRPPAGSSRSMLAVAPSRGGLRHTREEAQAVDALYRPNARALIGSDATESRFKRIAGDFRVLHLATHGYFNKASPLLSGLEFEADRSDDGMLRVHEILDLPLDADLVTLSACDTALGSGYFSDLPAGEEFVGLNRAFLTAGSASVVATLWQVDDRASLSLMKQFYSRLSASNERHGAANALALAQRNLRNSEKFSHPYYWAAYIVVGRANSSVEVAGRTTGRTS